MFKIDTRQAHSLKKRCDAGWWMFGCSPQIQTNLKHGRKSRFTEVESKKKGFKICKVVGMMNLSIMNWNTGLKWDGWSWNNTRYVAMEELWVRGTVTDVTHFGTLPRLSHWLNLWGYHDANESSFKIVISLSLPEMTVFCSAFTVPNLNCPGSLYHGKFQQDDCSDHSSWLQWSLMV